jgi:hypothetical protein
MAGVITRVGASLVGLALAQRRATRAFCRELRRQGLPEDIVQELSAEYPDFKDLNLKMLSYKG